MLLSLGGIYLQHADDNIANLEVNAECFHFYHIFSHLNVNKSRLHVMKSVSRVLATMKSLPVFLSWVFMMMTNNYLSLIYQAEPFVRR